MATKKALDDMYNIAISNSGDFEKADKIRECYNKIADDLETLEKHKKIEKELGCPIEVVIKALTKGVYVIDEQTKEIQCILRGLTTFTGSGLGTNYSGFIDERTWRKKVLYKGIEMSPMYYWKDYKKTWWLKEDKSE